MMDFSNSPAEKYKKPGDYENAELGSNEQNEKFLRLMGGGKKEKFKTVAGDTTAMSMSHDESRQETIDKDCVEKRNEEGNPIKEEQELINVKSANAWEKASLGDNNRKNKFLRLMGASKKSHTGKFVIGDSTRTDGRIVEPKEKELEEKLETQYNQGLELRLSGATRRHTGLGFQEPEISERSEEKPDDGSKQDQKSDERHHDREQRQDREENFSRPRYLDHRRDDRDYDRNRRDFRREDRKPYNRPRDGERSSYDNNRDGDNRRLYMRDRDHDRSYNRDSDRNRDNRADNYPRSQDYQRPPDPCGSQPPQTLLSPQTQLSAALLSQAPPPPPPPNPQLPPQATNQYHSNVHQSQVDNCSSPYQNQQWQQQQQQPVQQFPNLQQPPPPAPLHSNAAAYPPPPPPQQVNTTGNANQYPNTTPAALGANAQPTYNTQGYYNQQPQSYPYQVQPPPPPPPQTGQLQQQQRLPQQHLQSPCNTAAAPVIHISGNANATNCEQSASGSRMTLYTMPQQQQPPYGQSKPTVRSENLMRNFVKSSHQ